MDNSSVRWPVLSTLSQPARTLGLTGTARVAHWLPVVIRCKGQTPAALSAIYAVSIQSTVIQCVITYTGL